MHTHSAQVARSQASSSWVSPSNARGIELRLSGFVAHTHSYPLSHVSSQGKTSLLPVLLSRSAELPLSVPHQPSQEMQESGFSSLETVLWHIEHWLLFHPRLQVSLPCPLLPPGYFEISRGLDSQDCQRQRKVESNFNNRFKKQQVWSNTGMPQDMVHHTESR